MCAPIHAQTPHVTGTPTTATPSVVVQLANTSTNAFVGWHRVTVDFLPPAQSGWRLSEAPVTVQGHAVTGGGRNGDIEWQYVVGRKTGLETWACDIWCSLAAGQRTSIDLGTLTPCAQPVPQIPQEGWAWFGGMPMANGTALPLLSAQIDGAGWTAHWRSRVRGTQMMVVDLWTTWYPDQPWCHAEATVTASNPLVPQVTETLPAGITLSFGDAIVLPLGQAQPGVLVPSGTTFGDGQARTVPLTLVWLRHFSDPTQNASLIADAQYAIGGSGVLNLLPNGNPLVPANFDSVAWARGVLPASVAALHSWQPGTVGPAPASGITGAQTGDQVFVGGEICVPNSAGVELIRYLGALKYSNRPNHHREVDGSILDLARHTNPRLILWDGRPHPSSSVSPDRLGKTTNASETQLNGWWGPDVEHWLMNTLACAARLTGSPALQEELRSQATIYLAQWTVAPGLSTSWWFAARAVGWEAIACVHLWRELEDRALAERVKARFFARWDAFTATFASAVWWDVRVDDPRQGTGAWTMPWQCAVAAYGLDLAGEVFGVAAMREKAYVQAQHLVSTTFYENATTHHWQCYSGVAVDGRNVPDNIFWLFGSPLAPAVVLRHDATNATARAIWTQMIADATATYQAAWLPPGVPQ
jgi:hypothetical protein